MPSDLNPTPPPEQVDKLLRWEFDGEAMTAHQGDTVAIALLAAGKHTNRSTAVSGSPRGPYCLMGACFECLVDIDGKPNQQACLTLVTEGLVVRSMRGARTA